MPLTNHKSSYLNAVLNTPTFAIICIDKFGIIQEFNYGAELMFGYQAQEILNQNVSILMPSPCSTDHDSYLAAYFKTGNSKIIGSSRETVAKKKSGELFDIELRIDTFNDGSDTFFIGYILDVSHTKKLEKTNYDFESIVQNASYGILTLTLDSSIVLWNSGAKTITGYSSEDTIGKNIETLIKDLDNERIQNIFSGKLNNVKNVELTLKKQDGNIIDISATLSLIEDKYKKVIGISCVFHDISSQKRFVKDLQENLTLFRTVIDSASTAYILYDEDNGFIDYVNPAFEIFFGSSVSTINAWWNIAFLSPEYRENVATEWMIKMHNMVEDPQYVFEPMEIETIDKNGETKWFFVEATALRGMQTKTQLVTLNNITQIKKTSKSLEKSEFRWKFAIEGSGDGVWDWNVQTGDALYSKKWKEMLGYTENDILPTYEEWVTRIHPEDSKSVSETLQAYLQGKIENYVVEYRLRCKDECYKWILGRGMIVERDKHGNPFRMIGTHTDIHERKIIESKNQQLLNIVEKSIDFIAMFNLEHQITYLNCEGKQMIGLACGTSISDIKIADLFSEKELQKLFELSIVKAKKNGFWQGESILLHPQRRRIPVSQIVMAHFDSNQQLVAFSMIMRNVSAQKNMERIIVTAKEEAEQLVKSKSEFLANMSHEIRTPINAILGLAFILYKKSLPADEHMLVDKILKSGQLLLGTINDILDISKIDSGTCDLENAEFNLDSVLNNLATVMAFSFSQKDINLIISPPSNLKEITLIGDALRLQQILVNLTSNAIKFTHNGYVAVNVKYLKKTDNFVSLLFSIEDTGIGIAPQNQEAIFHTFAQADTSITRNYGGTGLGLSISRHLVRLMDGELLLQSTEGKGSTFSFCINFKYIQQKAATSVENKTLLIFDDNSLEREALFKTVSSLGWKPTLPDKNSFTLDAYEIILLDWSTVHKDNETFSRLLFEPQHKIIILHTEYERKNFSELMFDFPLKLAQIQSEILSSEFVFDTPPIFLNKPLTSSALQNAVLNKKNFIFEQSKRLNDLKILIVDDNAINLEVARRIFSDEGAIIVTVNDGFEAINWLKENKRENVDVVLMDIQMPGMDGCETTAWIHRMPDFENLPIIALSAGVLKSQMDKAQQAGIYEFITKPFNVDTAVEQICKVLNRSCSFNNLKNHTEEEPLGGLEFAGLDIEQAMQSWKDVDVYQTYLQKFLDSYAPEIEQIEKLLMDDMADTAHKIKGAARVLGLVDIGNITEELEELADAGESVTETIDNLKQHLAIAKNSIVAFRDSITNGIG